VDTDDDGDVDGGDDWWNYAFDTRWRVIAKYVGSSSDSAEEFVYQRAGRDGRGGSSYIDELALRDRDTTGNGALDERIYYCQNGKGDVSAIVDSSGRVVEMVRHSSYGVSIGIPGGDVDSDGDCDATDAAQVDSWIATTGYDIRGDVDLNGVLDATDASLIGSVHLGKAYGWGILSGSIVGNTRGAWGMACSGGESGTSNVRNRSSDRSTGRWLTRDPAGYADGVSLYQVLASNPLTKADPYGLYTITGVKCGGSAKPGEGCDIYGDDEVCLHFGSKVGNCWVGYRVCFRMECLCRATPNLKCANCQRACEQDLYDPAVSGNRWCNDLILMVNAAACADCCTRKHGWQNCLYGVPLIGLGFAICAKEKYGIWCGDTDEDPWTPWGVEYPSREEGSAGHGKLRSRDSYPGVPIQEIPSEIRETLAAQGWPIR